MMICIASRFSGITRCPAAVLLCWMTTAWLSRFTSRQRMPFSSQPRQVVLRASIAAKYADSQVGRVPGLRRQEFSKHRNSGCRRWEWTASRIAGCRFDTSIPCLSFLIFSATIRGGSPSSVSMSSTSSLVSASWGPELSSCREEPYYAPLRTYVLRWPKQADTRHRPKQRISTFCNRILAASFYPAGPQLRSKEGCQWTLERDFFISPCGPWWQQQW